MRKTSVCPVLAAVAVAFVLSEPAPAQTRGDDVKAPVKIDLWRVNQFAAQILEPAGVDPEDQGALIGAVRGERENVAVASAAAYALGLYPASAAIDDALLAAARSPNEQLMSAAAVSLAAHGNFAWADDAVSRLPGMQDIEGKIRVAGALGAGRPLRRMAADPIHRCAEAEREDICRCSLMGGAEVRRHEGRGLQDRELECGARRDA